jgi:tetratricopeptide (TPR) repeat protein
MTGGCALVSALCGPASSLVVAKQLLPCHFEVYGHARTRRVIPNWLSSFAFQPVSNLARSIRLAFASRCVLVIRLRSYLFRELGDLDQAIKLYEQAVALDPLRANSHLSLGYLLYVAGRYDAAQAELQKALDLNLRAALVHVTLGKILIAKGKPQQALAEIEKEPCEWGKLTGQVLVYHALGRGQDSNAALAELVAKYDTKSAFQIAQAHAFRGESDQAFEWLERAYKQRDSGLPDIKIDPLFKTLRHDPRFIALLKKIRLPI